MPRAWSVTAVAGALLCAAQPVAACRAWHPPNLEDVRFADRVVIGRIANYHIVLDEKARRDRKKWLATHPDMPAKLRDSLANQSGWISDYARFDVIVDQVLLGKAPRRLTVTWDASTYAEPATMKPGPWLIALRDPASPLPIRGGSATIFPNKEPTLPTVLHPACSSAIIYEAGSPQTAAIRKLLRARRR